jgi:purine nucleoside permease
MRIARFPALPRRLAALGAIALAALGGCAAPGTQAPPAPLAPKVMIVTMFESEAEPWIKPLALDTEIAVPGLPPEYPSVRCNRDLVCLVTTGMGHANAAASTAALVFSRRFDLGKTYFLIAGIAGIDPNFGTIGSAAWARYLVDFGLAHEIDAREMPPDWKAGYFGLGAAGPDLKPKPEYRTEVFRLNESLLQHALRLSRQAQLEDSDEARRYRANYPQAPAHSAPAVLQCDTAAGDTWWHGRLLGEAATRWVALWTDGQGRYCTTQQEDNATYEALRRGANAGLLDLQRAAVLRTGSNFDRPYPGQSAFQSIRADSGGFRPALANLVRAGRPLVDAIVADWPKWRDGIPPQ